MSSRWPCGGQGQCQGGEEGLGTQLTLGHSLGDTHAGVTAHTRLRPPEEPGLSSLSQPTPGD